MPVICAAHMSSIRSCRNAAAFLTYQYINNLQPDRYSHSLQYHPLVSESNAGSAHHPIGKCGRPREIEGRVHSPQNTRVSISNTLDVQTLARPYHTACAHQNQCCTGTTPSTSRSLDSRAFPLSRSSRASIAEVPNYFTSSSTCRKILTNRHLLPSESFCHDPETNGNNEAHTDTFHRSEPPC